MGLDDSHDNPWIIGGGYIWGLSMLSAPSQPFGEKMRDDQRISAVDKYIIIEKQI